MDLWEIERGLISSGYNSVCGIDEAGRGPLAGPVFAAAVILPFGINIPFLDDSKKLSEKIRENLYDEITAKAIDYGIGSADNHEVDGLNILKATFLSMNRAVDALKTKPDLALVDGNRDPFVKCRSKLIVGGDGKSASIAAASILAKVSRDRFMSGLQEKYPQYSFSKHKGYGTKQHFAELLENGPSDVHRISFLSKLKEKSRETSTNTRLRGKLGEVYALEHLKEQNYSVVAESYSTRFGEIDLIVKNSEYIVFVEVKLRKNDKFAAAREFVGKEKQRKLTAAAKLWLQSNNTDLQPRFDVIEVYAPDDFASPEIIHIENAF